MIIPILETTPIKCFFNVLPVLEPEEEMNDLIAEFREKYVEMLLNFLKTLNKSPGNKSVLKKMIKECYKIIF